MLCKDSYCCHYLIEHVRLEGLVVASSRVSEGEPSPIA